MAKVPSSQQSIAQRFEIMALDERAVPQRLVIDDAIELGRDPHCDIRLLVEGASRFHARLQKNETGKDTHIELIDLQSRNGTRIHGNNIHHEILEDGTTFECSGVSFIFFDNSKRLYETRIVDDSGNNIPGREIQTEKIKKKEKTTFWNEKLLQRWLHIATHESAHAALQKSCIDIAQALHCRQSAIISQGQILAGKLRPSLAGRLSATHEARLLLLGRDLHGQTIAQENIGCALSIPFFNKKLDEAPTHHLLLIRGIESDEFEEADLRHALELRRILPALLPQIINTKQNEDDILIGSGETMQQLRKRIMRLARCDAPILIHGESGSGKEVIAQSVHQRSARNQGPFVAVNCAAIVESLFEAELFGHEQGAFSGANTSRQGRIRAADGGTLFLDEIGELPLAMQAKLLRVLQEGQVDSVGSEHSIDVNVRILCATNRDLAQMVSEGSFREDLFYRLDVLRIAAPALREHAEDIPDLCKHIMRKAAREQGCLPRPIQTAALKAMNAYSWPGNVRQLINTLTRALIMADHEITAEILELDQLPFNKEEIISSSSSDKPLASLAEVEAAHIRRVLQACAGNKSAAARTLGISRPTLRQKLSGYGIDL